MFVNTKDLFLKPQVMKFMDLVQFQTTQVIFKASHNMLHGNVQHFFKTWGRRCDLRGRCRLKQPRVCSTLTNSLWRSYTRTLNKVETLHSIRIHIWWVYILGLWVYVYYEPIVVLLYRMRILVLVFYTQLIVFMYTCICTDTILVWRS